MRASGGTELNAVRTAERLDRSRFELTVFTLSLEGPMADRYAAIGVPVVHMPTPSLVGWSAGRRALAFARVLAAGRFDIVHCHDKYSNVFATVAGRLAGVPAIIASKRWLRTSLPHRILNTVAYRLAGRVLANSDGVARSLRRVEFVPASRIAVVPNFVEADAFLLPSAEERARRRAALGVPTEAVVVGITARLHDVKDHASLIRATARIADRFPELRVVVAGEGELRPSLERLAESLGVADRVVFAGFVPPRPNPHALFDVSVLCSLHEGFPNAVVEAMAAGRPVVATDVGGTPDAVEHEVTGLLVPPAQPERLADAIASLLADPERAARMGRAGAERARARFDAAAIVESLEALYVDLVRQSGPRRAR
jgi:L-malate glycosyltransferase